MPLVLTSRRPVKHLWRVGSSVLVAGLITSAILGYAITWSGTALTGGLWVLVLFTETFLCALHGNARPASLAALVGWRPSGQESVRTGWEHAEPAKRQPLHALLDPRPFRRKGLAPILIVPPTGEPHG
jgi:hypothetical protein